MGESHPVEIGAAFGTYVILILIRISGFADVVRAVDVSGVIFLDRIQEIVQFVFYDFYVLLFVGLVSSAILMTVSYFSRAEDQFRLLKLISATGMGVPALVYIVGSIYLFLF